MKTVLKFSCYLFAFLGVIFIPAATFLAEFQDHFAQFVFGGIVSSFGIEDVSFSSDTQGLYLLLLILFGVAVFLSFLLNQWSYFKNRQERIIHLFKLILIYYLASRFLVYGFDKLFKTQFYLPEPNTLYTPFGKMTKDILFWSTMGTSKLYCFLTGLFELIPAVLLLFKKTRTFGLFVLLFVITNVLMINFGFDISVKLYSLFLLFICLLLLAPNMRTFYLFFKGEVAQLKVDKQNFDFLNRAFIKGFLKTGLIGLMFLEATFFAFSTGNFNDDSAERPYLHGAYQLEDITFGTENIYERFYIHRRGFIIFETKGGYFLDYKLEIDSVNQQFLIWGYDDYANQIDYQLYEGESKISLQWPGDSENQILMYEKLDWRSLPALEDEFHWTIESYQTRND